MTYSPISKSGRLTNGVMEELDAFLLADDSLENAMNESTVDGFLCAVLSGRKVVMPSEWMRWVWDEERGEQAREFASEKQAQRILSLLIRQANVIAFTLTQTPQYFEPLFLERKVKGRTVSIVDEWCCGYPQPQDLVATVLQYQQPVEQSERNGRNHEQVHRRDAVGMIIQERPPALGRRSPTLCHVFGDRRLPHIDAKLEELAVDARCTP